MKFLLFGLLWFLFGSPFVAIILVLLLLYALDRRFVGLFPSVTRPFKRNRALSRALQDIRERPFDVSAKQEAARLYMEKKRWSEARRLLESILPAMDHSAEVLCDLGICQLKTGSLQEGERTLHKALEINPRVRYGEPYLRLAEALAPIDSERAAEALRRFAGMNSSSSELYYRLGRLYAALGRKQQAKAAYQEAIDIYRSLPKYKRKTERRWALLAAWRRAVG